jgi:hypothetical protein
MFVTRKRFEREVHGLHSQVFTLEDKVRVLESREREHRAQVARYTECLSSLLRHLNIRLEYEEARPAQYVLKEGK